MDVIIRKLLQTENTVILPDLGAIVKLGKTFQFNKFLKFNDGKLIKFVEKEDGISAVEAKKKVSDFVAKAQTAIDAGGAFMIQGFGELSEKNGNIILKLVEGGVNHVSESKKEEKPISTSVKEQETKEIKEKVKTEQKVEQKKETVAEAKKEVQKPVEDFKENSDKKEVVKEVVKVTEKAVVKNVEKPKTAKPKAKDVSSFVSLIKKSFGFISTVVIPDLGAIVKVDDSFIFNENLNESDYSLANILSKEKNISIDLASSQVKEFVEIVKTEIKENGAFKFDAFGTLTTANGAYCFKDKVDSSTAKVETLKNEPVLAKKEAKKEITVASNNDAKVESSKGTQPRRISEFTDESVAKSKPKVAASNSEAKDVEVTTTSSSSLKGVSFFELLKDKKGEKYKSDGKGLPSLSANLKTDSTNDSKKEKTNDSSDASVKLEATSSSSLKDVSFWALLKDKKGTTYAASNSETPLASATNKVKEETKDTSKDVVTSTPEKKKEVSKETSSSKEVETVKVIDKEMVTPLSVENSESLKDVSFFALLKDKKGTTYAASTSETPLASATNKVKEETKDTSKDVVSSTPEKIKEVSKETSSSKEVEVVKEPEKEPEKEVVTSSSNQSSESMKDISFWALLKDKKGTTYTASTSETPLSTATNKVKEETKVESKDFVTSTPEKKKEAPKETSPSKEVKAEKATEKEIVTSSSVKSSESLKDVSFFALLKDKKGTTYAATPTSEEDLTSESGGVGNGKSSKIKAGVTTTSKDTVKETKANKKKKTGKKEKKEKKKRKPVMWIILLLLLLALIGGGYFFRGHVYKYYAQTMAYFSSDSETAHADTDADSNTKKNEKHKDSNNSNNNGHANSDTSTFTSDEEILDSETAYLGDADKGINDEDKNAEENADNSFEDGTGTDAETAENNSGNGSNTDSDNNEELANGSQPETATEEVTEEAVEEVVEESVEEAVEEVVEESVDDTVESFESSSTSENAEVVNELKSQIKDLKSEIKDLKASNKTKSEEITKLNSKVKSLQGQLQTASTSSGSGIASSGGDYHVIIGSYSDKSNARHKADKMKAKGYGDSFVVGKYGGLYIVSIGSYASDAAAKSAMDSYKASGGGSAFVKGDI